MPPCSSGNDLPGVSKIEIEIDFCHQRDRQAQHLHTVSGCKQTPASSHEEELAAIQATSPQVVAEESRVAVIKRFKDGTFPFLLLHGPLGAKKQH